MNRRKFIRLGGCCATLALCKRGAAELPAATAKPAVAPSETASAGLTPPAGRIAFAEKWAKRLFDVLDANLDETARARVMLANGRACCEAAQKGKPTLALDSFLENMKKHAGPDSIRREGNVGYLNYAQNSRGLKVADGYCLCPLVESGPKDLYKTYCLCSIGYVQYLFGSMVGHPVKVELLESPRSGGKSCRFRILLACA